MYYSGVALLVMSMMVNIICFSSAEWQKIGGITCEESSSDYDDRFECSNAVDGILYGGVNGGEWATRDEGTGAYIELALPGLYEIKQIHFLQRYTYVEQFKDVELLFDKYTKINVSISMYLILYDSSSYWKLQSKINCVTLMLDWITETILGIGETRKWMRWKSV